MINESGRLLTLNRIKTEDFSPDDSSDWIILRLNSKINSQEIRYNELLIRIHNFISKLSCNIDKLFDSFDLKSQNEFLSEISYFQKKTDQIYANFAQNDIKYELIDKLNDPDFTKSGYKQLILSIFGELSSDYEPRTAAHSRRRSQDLDFDCRRSITPLKSSRISTSPCDKASNKCINCQNPKIPGQGLELNSNQRELFKPIKENLNSDLAVLVKGLKDDNEILNMKLNCSQSKLTYIVSCVYKFIANTSKFQKVKREQEGFVSLMDYETEKHKIEVKLREILEGDEISWKRNSPIKTKRNEIGKVEGSKIGLKRKSSDLGQGEKINFKLIEEISKQYNEKIEALTNNVVKLESENRSVKNKFFVVSKELKQCRNLNDARIGEFVEKYIREFMKMIRENVSRVLRDFNFRFEEKMKVIASRMVETDLKIDNMKKMVIKVLNKNLNSLIELNKQADKSLKLKEYMEEIENLKFLIDQNTVFYENKHQSMQSLLESAEVEKNKLIKQLQESQIKINLLQKENLAINELNSIKISNESHIEGLRLEIDKLNQINRNLQINQALIQDLRYENDSLVEEIQSLREEIFNKTNYRIIKTVGQESPNSKIAMIDKEIMTEKNLDDEFNYSLTENSPFNDERYSKNEENFNENLGFSGMVLISSQKIMQLGAVNLNMSEICSIGIPASEKNEECLEININWQCENQGRLQQLSDDLRNQKKLCLKYMLDNECIRAELLKTRDTYKKLLNFNKSPISTPRLPMAKLEMSRYSLE